MFYKIIKYLKESHLVSVVEILELIEEEKVKILKLKAELKDRSYLYITEVHTIGHQKYSYHWQDQTGKLLIRWDNSPHWPNITTFPHHKHVGSKVLPSNRATIDEVLREIENFMKTKKPKEEIIEGN